MRAILPSEIIAPSNVSVFIAGTIDMGNSIDWQQKFIDRANKEETLNDVVVFNPRRKSWDHTWAQTIENAKFSEQVNWEMDAMENADVILLFLEANSKSPISMMELGLFADSGKLMVCCEEGFWRKGNIDIVCQRKGIDQYNTFDELSETVITKLKKFVNIK
ncbi:nucleoside 2-deoxyribosyltransferase domain-containing protein [Pedobacter sp. D749]|uniref:nucleoside 2-deoxyribosyltransferase domain-containing protein n=1 Tax=Pedobacter sp. D749 TaxID=2856523 RepID=UPI001C564F29|nr:nucleoside 2-deoxyribosyltransferase domain-containing protein [Pedobacter sp. D749]QXU42666.1 nucleoside 2-deoxyribosyltransferase domain-containing protein [Pedobacter sp. D749]